jgi:WNK lysine deficient protein kinase
MTDTIKGNEEYEGPNRRYLKMKEIIGRGGYKVVFRAIDRCEGIEVAWNEVKLDGNVDVNKLKREVSILQQLDNENIIKFYTSWVDRENLKFIFITELMSSGSLRSFIHKAHLVSKKAIKSYAIQILHGLKHLHENKEPIVHRDIKLDNMFFHGTEGRVKIGDFGLATMLNKDEKPLTVIGTPHFMAPELFF